MVLLVVHTNVPEKTCMRKKKMKNATVILVYITFPLTMILHLTNILMMLVKKKLRKPKYILLMSLSISDFIVMVVVTFQLLFSIDNVFFYTARKFFSTVSILSTLSLTVDRYVAVVYCLKYQAYVTRVRIIGFIMVIWIWSLLISLIPAVLQRNPGQLELYGDYISKPLNFVVCILLLVGSFWIRKVRNVHIDRIKERNVYFGVAGEKLSVLQSLKTSIMDVMKLNIVTAVLIIVYHSTSAISKYFFKQENFLSNSVAAVFGMLYLISNPIVYVLNMSELKQEYKKTYYSWKKGHIWNMVGPF